MKKVSISADLERRLRAGDHPLIQEIVGLLDEVEKKRATGSAAKSDGLGYKELVALFRSELGPDLLLPPKASPVYIIKLVNKAKEYGITQETAGRIAAGLRRAYRPPYALGFVVNRADEHYSRGLFPEQQDLGDPDSVSGVSVVVHGRGNFIDED